VTDEKGGKEIHPYAAALGKMVSLALKMGVKAADIADVLENISGGSISYDFGAVESVPALIAKLLRHGPEPKPSRSARLENEVNKTPQQFVDAEAEGSVFASGMKDAPRVVVGQPEPVDICPQCNGMMYPMSGCLTCLNCGFGKCA